MGRAGGADGGWRPIDGPGGFWTSGRLFFCRGTILGVECRRFGGVDPYFDTYPFLRNTSALTHRFLDHQGSHDRQPVKHFPSQGILPSRKLTFNIWPKR